MCRAVLGWKDVILENSVPLGALLEARSALSIFAVLLAAYEKAIKCREIDYDPL